MQANNANTSTGTGMTKPILGAVFLILVLVGLYYLYQYLYGSSPAQGTVSILDGNKSAQTTSQVSGSNKNVVASSEISGMADGGEYTVSFWGYVADTKQMTKLVNLMEINAKGLTSGGARQGKTFLFVGLDPKTGTLIVRQNTSDGYSIDNVAASTGSTSYQLNDLITNYGTQATYKQDDRCDILNGIEYQRWVLITVVGNSRTLDVYVDGKLARSCLYKGMNATDSSDGKANVYFGLDNGNNFKGYFSSGTFANYAYTPDKVWSTYQAGPGSGSSLGSFFKNLFNVNVTFGSTQGLQP